MMIPLGDSKENSFPLTSVPSLDIKKTLGGSSPILAKDMN